MKEQKLRKHKFNQLVYLSIRESDGAFAGYKQSVSVFGSGKNNNVALNKQTNRRYNHDNVNNFDLLDNFFVNGVREISKKNPDAVFAYYGKHRVPYLPKDVQAKIVNQPSEELIFFFEDKFESRKWVKDFLPVLDYYFLNKNEISYQKCKTFFPQAKRFVLQARQSSGGAQTYLFTKTNEKDVLARLSDGLYAVSEYKENNIGINFHFVISEKSIRILHPSVQLIDTRFDNMNYAGCDYALYSKILSEKTQKKALQQTKRLTKQMQKMGYRGVAGVDFIVSDKIYFMEVNPRFQSSTNVLNMALKQNKLPTVNELDNMAFSHKYLPKIPEIKVNYSKICLVKGEKNVITDKPYKILWDGYTESEYVEKGTYLYTLIYKGSIYKKLFGKNK